MFGGGGDKGPIQGLFDSSLGRIDSWFKDLNSAANPKPKPAPSLVTAPATPASVDTPGRHKSLLGA